MILLASNRFDYIFIGKIDQAGLPFADRIKIIQDLNERRAFQLSSCYKLRGALEIFKMFPRDYVETTCNPDSWRLNVKYGTSNTKCMRKTCLIKKMSLFLSINVFSLECISI